MKEKKPWHDIHISKKQRKGKTPEEIQKLREAIYNSRYKPHFLAGSLKQQDI